MADNVPKTPTTMRMRDIGPDADDRRREAAARRERNKVDSSSYVPARILWPALAFPAVIAPGGSGGGLATRTICLLLVSSSNRLSKADVARHLRWVPWSDRRKRHLPTTEDGGTNAFAEEDLNVRLAGLPGGDHFLPRQAPGGPIVFPPTKGELTQLISFAADAGGKNGMLVGLSRFVIKFYADHGLKHLYEVQVYEHAASALAPAALPYHLFWINPAKGDDKRSAELDLLLEYARSSRFGHDGVLEPKHFQKGKAREDYVRKYLDEYEYEFSAKSSRGPAQRTEVLHPVFVRSIAPRLRVGHVTDLHIDIRTDAYEKNLKKAGQTQFHNWNRACEWVYQKARAACDILLLGGDLIDYGRGYNDAGRMGDDKSYWRDRDWFLFYDFLAAGSNYQKPVYSILGNHDWRINPYPAITFGSPDADDMALTEDGLRIAHGPGENQFTYATDLGMVGAFLLDKLFRRDGRLRLGGSPLETRIESVAWYLLLMNPFLDYSFTLPGGYNVVMLDWANEEVVDRPEVAGGVDYGRSILIPNTGAPMAKNSVTNHQRRLLEFTAEARGPKILGIHAPPLGPWSHWSDDNLANARVKFTPEEAEFRKGKPPQRGATVTIETTYKDGKEVGTRRIYEHPARAIRLSKDDPAGQEADKGSIVKQRDWLVRFLRDSGFQLVLAGHIHRPNVLFIYIPQVENGKPADYHGQWLVKCVDPTQAPQQPLPLFINTTSAGPLGNVYESRGNTRKAPSGYSEILLSQGGKIENVEFVSNPASIVYGAILP